MCLLKERAVIKRSLSSIYSSPHNAASFPNGVSEYHNDDIGFHSSKLTSFPVAPWISSSTLSSPSSAGAVAASVTGATTGIGLRTYGAPPSPMEVSNAIAAAKQASANVMIAQQQVQAAKENVLNQQHIASEKETHATILTQKSEAAAAIQRSEAAAAAQSVILAQQRLATAKHTVSQHQRIASSKEAIAAAALYNSAHAAAEEIQRTEQEAARLALIQRTGSASFAHHLTATKDSIILPLHSGNNHVSTNYLKLPSPLASWNSQNGAVLSTGSSVNLWPSTGGANAYISPTISPVHPVKPATYNIWG